MAPFTMERTHTDSYRIRSSTTYPGDYIQLRTWEFNGRAYDFTRCQWGDGSSTIRVYRGGTTVLIREWTQCGMWTDPGYLGLDDDTQGERS